MKRKDILGLYDLSAEEIDGAEHEKTAPSEHQKTSALTG